MIKMKIGIVGCGAISKRVHIPNFRKMDDTEIVAIADINENAVNSCSRDFNIPNAYINYNEMLEKSEIDLVSICTPNFLHKDVAIAAANAGKHILIEKPLALSVKECEEILDAVDKNGVKLCVVQNYRYFPAVQDAKKIILDHNIGKIISIYGQGHVFPPAQWSSSTWFYEKYGLLYDFGSHLIDMALWLNPSKVKGVYASGGNLEGEFDIIDHAQIMLQFDDNSLATLDLSWMTGMMDIYVNIQGTGGSLKLDVRNSNLQELHGYWTPIDDIISTSKKIIKVTGGVLTGNYFLGATQFHEIIIKEFIESIKRNSNVPVSGKEGKNVVEVIEASIKSLERNTYINLE